MTMIPHRPHQRGRWSHPRTGICLPGQIAGEFFVCLLQLPIPEVPEAHLPSRSSNSVSLDWRDFFSQELFLEEVYNETNIVHHVYLTPPSDSGPLFVMHHGAGSSGLSFATCAKEIRKILPKAGMLSLDARDHGSTTTKSEPDGGPVELDLSLDTLSRDLVFAVKAAQSKMNWKTLPDIVLVGHSLGGAVITDVAKKGELSSKLLAYAVLDVVEGMMKAFIHILPSHCLLNMILPQVPQWTPYRAWSSTSPPVQPGSLLYPRESNGST